MNTKTKNHIFTAVTIVLIALAILIFLFLLFGWQINYKTHATASTDGITVSLKGNGRQIRRVIIERDGAKKLSLPFSADLSVADASETPLFLLQDANFDNHADLLILSAADTDGDIHRTVLFYDSTEETFTADENPIVLVNAIFEADVIRTSGKFRKEYAKASDNTPPVYEERDERAIYTMINGILTRTEERAITYYSESDIYCYSVYSYDKELGELSYVDEQWFEETERAKYKLD